MESLPISFVERPELPHSSLTYGVDSTTWSAVILAEGRGIGSRMMGQRGLTTTISSVTRVSLIPLLFPAGMGGWRHGGVVCYLNCLKGRVTLQLNYILSLLLNFPPLHPIPTNPCELNYTLY